MQVCVPKISRAVFITVVLASFITGGASASIHDLTFRTQDLGYPVTYFEPVDIDDDGLWELALQVGVDGDSVGVYSPFEERWIDGPHYLPIERNNWGCGDFDNDGFADYAYLRQDSVLIFNARMAFTSFTFEIAGYPELYPRVMQVWGESEFGEPTVFVSETDTASVAFCDSTLDYQPYYPDTCVYDLLYTTLWHAYSLTTGQYLGETDGMNQKGRVCFTKNDPPAAYLCVFEHNRRYEHPRAEDDFGLNVGTCSMHLRGQTGVEFSSDCLLTVENVEDTITWPFGWPAITSVELAEGDFAELPKLYWQLQGWIDGSYRLGGVTRTKYCAPDWQFTPDSPYAGIACIDNPLSPNLVLVMSRADGSGWDIRDRFTGTIIDSLPNLPPADIRTAPILENNFLDLYFFQDSTLYILERPGMPTGILAEEEQTTIPETFTLYQNHPNPFNASTVIEFELPHAGDVHVEIFDILGQKVVTLVDGTKSAGRHQVIWNPNDAVSGIYFYRLTLNGSRSCRKMILLK